MNDLRPRLRNLSTGLLCLALALSLLACGEADTPGVFSASASDTLSERDLADPQTTDTSEAEEDSEEESSADTDATEVLQLCLLEGSHYAPGEEIPTDQPSEYCWCNEALEVACAPACVTDDGHFAPGEDVPTEVVGQSCWCSADYEVQCAGGPAPEDTQSAPSDAETEADAGPSEPLVPEPEVSADFDLCSAPGGDFNIYDIQNPSCPDHDLVSPNPTAIPGISLTFEEVVVTGVFGDTFFVQEKTGGPYSGIACYAGTVNFSMLSPGDVITVWGTYYEFYDLTQLTVEDFEVTEVVSPLAPFEIVHPAHVATGGPLSEMFEGVLVRVSDLETIDTKPDCPHDFGEFSVTGDLRIDDMAKDLWDPHLGDTFAAITGVLHYTFGEFKLEPRTMEDFEVIEAGAMSALTKCIEADCIAPEGAAVSRIVVVNEVMVNPYGDDEGQEWIELYNPGSEAIDLNGWTVKDCAEQAMVLVGSNLTLPAGGYLVLGAEEDASLNGGVPVDITYPSPFYLANSVGAVLLYDAQGVLVDQTRYSAFEPWEVMVAGHSLARVSPTSDGTQPEAWETGQDTFGTNNNHGTPGGPN